VVNVYGLTHTDVQTQELSFLQDVDTAKLTAAIQRAAGDLNTELIAMRVNPADITAGAFPNDFEWCRSTLLYGAAALYLRNMTGAEQAATVKTEAFGARIRMFRDRPQMLAVYNATATGALIARGPGNFGDVEAAAHARTRFLDPSRVDRWRQ
jgi:hypothetical protein